MKTIQETLQEKFAQAIQASFPDVQGLNVTAEVTRSTQEQFGDYQCNSAMRLTKLLKQNPRQIAQAIISQMDDHQREGSSPMIAKLEIAGPGFINIFLDSTYLAKVLQGMSLDLRLGVPIPTEEKRIAIDFSSPNTAKEMHVGHLRSTIIGDALARLFEFLGHEVLRINHIGDWGTAFGMLICYMKEQAPEVLVGAKKTDLSHLVVWYKESKLQFDTDPEFKKRSQQEVVALQSGDLEARYAWEIICAISRRAYQEIYDFLDIKLIERGESFYNPMLPEVIQDFEKKGLLQRSNGASCVFLEGFINREGEPLPLMLQKSDGGYNYDTTDMAAIKQRIRDERADQLIYVTDAGQANHFAMVFKAAEMVGYLDPQRVQVDHVPFGMVLGADGKKFRTRSGEVEKLADLLKAAVDKADEILIERGVELPEAERKELAHTLGVGAVKYADLSSNRTGDYVFSYDRMLRFEGNTAAYLMYSYVRVQGIKRKIGFDSLDAIKQRSEIRLEHPSEISLGAHLSRFGETLDRMSAELLPNRLTDYLYELAEKFNAFFRDCRVEGTEQQEQRLLLCDLVARVLKQGLAILGVKTPERM